MSTDIKISKVQSLLDKWLNLIMEDGVPLNKNIILPLGFAAAASTADEDIQKRCMKEELN